MQTDPNRQIPESSLMYAESMYRYAALRLDPFDLRCWIIRRLMVDDGLDHDVAEQAFDHALEAAATSARPPRQRRRHQGGMLSFAFRPSIHPHV